jgi:hypothetical protein
VVEEIIWRLKTLVVGQGRGPFVTLDSLAPLSTFSVVYSNQLGCKLS